MIRLLTQADREIILEYIMRNEVETSFLYANIIEFGIDNVKEIRRCADYYGFFEGEILRGILPFYNLGSCIPHYEVDSAIPLFCDIMKKRKFEFLLGMKKIIQPLYDGIKDYKQILEYDESAYLVNNNLKEYKLDDVKFIDATKTINDKVVNFLLEAREIGFNQVITKNEIRKMLVQQGKEEDFIIAEKDEKIVAQACIQTYTPTINQIGSVYTSKNERCKGYGKAVVSQLCTRIINRGKVPTLSVKKDNIPAIKAYKALGFEHFDDYLIIKYK